MTGLNVVLLSTEPIDSIRKYSVYRCIRVTVEAGVECDEIFVVFVLCELVLLERSVSAVSVL